MQGYGTEETENRGSHERWVAEGCSNASSRPRGQASAGRAHRSFGLGVAEECICENGGADFTVLYCLYCKTNWTRFQKLMYGCINSNHAFFFAVRTFFVGYCMPPLHFRVALLL